MAVSRSTEPTKPRWLAPARGILDRRSHGDGRWDGLGAMVRIARFAGQATGAGGVPYGCHPA